MGCCISTLNETRRETTITYGVRDVQFTELESRQEKDLTGCIDTFLFHIQRELKVQVPAELTRQIVAFCGPLLRTLQNGETFIALADSDSGIGSVSFAMNAAAAQRMCGVSKRTPLRVLIRCDTVRDVHLDMNTDAAAIFGPKCWTVRPVNPRTLRVTETGWGIVLYGEGKALNLRDYDRLRICFRINALQQWFSVGYVHSVLCGQRLTIRLNDELGAGRNIKHSVGILVHRDTFKLFDKDNQHTRLPTSLRGVSFPIPEQKWLLEYDFKAGFLSLYLHHQERWLVGTKHLPWN